MKTNSRKQPEMQEHSDEIINEYQLVETFFSDAESGYLLANFCFMHQVSVIHSPQADEHVCFIDGKKYSGKTFMGALIKGISKFKGNWISTDKDNSKVKDDKQLEARHLSMVNENGNNIKFIENPSEEIQLAAVGQDGYSIRFIENPSEEVQLTAVKQNGCAIECIKNPSEEVQLEAVRENVFALSHIESPTKNVWYEAAKLLDKNGHVVRYLQ